MPLEALMARESVLGINVDVSLPEEQGEPRLASP